MLLQSRRHTTTDNRPAEDSTARPCAWAWGRPRPARTEAGRQGAERAPAAAAPLPSPLAAPSPFPSSEGCAGGLHCASPPLVATSKRAQLEARGLRSRYVARQELGAQARCR